MGACILEAERGQDYASGHMAARRPCKKGLQPELGHWQCGDSFLIVTCLKGGDTQEQDSAA